MKRANLHDYFVAYVLELKMSLTSQRFKEMVSLTKGGHMAPTHCTGVSHFLLETSDIYALQNLIFVEYYNLNFLFMTIMTCVPPSLNIFGSLKNLISPKFRPRQGWLLGSSSLLMEMLFHFLNCLLLLLIIFLIVSMTQKLFLMPLNIRTS